jgi:hypothetical protein
VPSGATRHRLGWHRYRIESAYAGPAAPRATAPATIAPALARDTRRAYSPAAARHERDCAAAHGLDVTSPGADAQA